MRLTILSLVMSFLLFSCTGINNITKMPRQEEFQDLKEVVSLLDTKMPVPVRETVDSFTIEDMEQGKALSYDDTVNEYISNNKKIEKPMVVQYSVITMDASLNDFLKVIPIENWGSHLAGWKGGEVKQIPSEPENNSRYQAERMVLALGNDMTKAEIIETTDTTASVFWRVYYSDNDSTLSDVGKLEITALGEKKIKVIFHSAHDLKFYGFMRLPKFIVRPGLERTFLEHLRKYKKTVLEAKK
jgi:hypothetical protein